MASAFGRSISILVHWSSARQPRSSGNRGPEMVFGDTEERLSQFGDKWQILKCYSRALSDETRSGPRIATFLGSIFFTRLAEFHPCKALLPSGEDGEGSGEPCAAAVCAPGALHR